MSKLKKTIIALAVAAGLTFLGKLIFARVQEN